MSTSSESLAMRSPGAANALMSLDRVSKHFPIRSGLLMRSVGSVKAVRDVSFDLPAGQTVGIVGESGSGKSTLGRVIAGLYPATSGSVRYDGRDISEQLAVDPLWYRRQVQMIFQDPYSSLNPRHTIGAILGRPLLYHKLSTKDDLQRRLTDVMDKVGLGAWALNRYPHEFSGGQRQRIAVARALILDPKVIICDEPVAALDVSIQAQILNLLADLRRELGISYIFIAHDLAVVKHLCENVAVMYLGKIVEYGDRESIFGNPQHPYTQCLLQANPIADGKRRRRHFLLKGEIPSPVAPPPGCSFHTRCPFVDDSCKSGEFPLRHVGGAASSFQVACNKVKALGQGPKLEMAPGETH